MQKIMPTPLLEKLPMRTVASLTGMNPITLRAWERRYGLLRPLRTAKGHRLYTHEHVEQIRRVVALVERGVPISRVGDVLDAEGARERSGIPKGPWGAYLEQMAAATSRFDEAELDRVYDEALSLQSIDRVTRGLLLPLLVRLGERWKDLPGGIAEEHFFSTYLRSKLGARLQHRVRYATGPRLLAACAPGEQHEIGLLLFALEAQSAGMRPIVLGADTPLPEIAVACRASESDAIVLSTSVEPAAGLLEKALPAFTRVSDVPVFIGGATAVAHRRAIAKAGAIALGVGLEDGVRLIGATLARAKGAR
jgi:DNA-binding transcriptional MerR regulator/methylmalonyl-CoA mutase cobalamin-binding subunit